MTEIETRAAKIFGKRNGAVAWPIGVHSPQRSLKRTTPEWWAREVAEQPNAQRCIVEWAERYGLKESDKACCPNWLLRKVSQRCSGNRCTHYGHLYDAVDHDWLDHTTGWLLDGKPVAITSAPYGLRDEDRQRLGWWQAKDPRLSVATGGPGWYGYTTTQVVMWRSDRIPVMEPAEDAQRGVATS